LWQHRVKLIVINVDKADYLCIILRSFNDVMINYQPYASWLLTRLQKTHVIANKKLLHSLHRITLIVFMFDTSFVALLYFCLWAKHGNATQKYLSTILKITLS